MTFSSPWLLVFLAALPLLWLLLRATPPAPRAQEFPAIALLLNLSSTPTPARTPWWLLALRLAAAGLAIVGLAGPQRAVPHLAAAGAPLVLVVDNGWAAAADWSDRLRAAAAAVAPDASLRLLTTAPDADGQPPSLGPAMPARDLPARLAVLKPQPWPTDRGAAAAALAALPAATRAIYVADGVAGTGDAGFGAALHRLAGISQLRGAGAPILLRGETPGEDATTVQAQTLPGHPATALLRATDASGAVLAEAPLALDASGAGSAQLIVPPALRGRVAALRLADVASAGAVWLRDGQGQRHPVGLVAGGPADDAPLTGPLYYLRRALEDGGEVRTGPLAGLIDAGVSMIVLADETVIDPATQTVLAAWVRHGGLLLRFAGPNLAAATAPDPLLPVTLLPGDRALGGAMSWSHPAALAAFPPGSAFAGLAVPGDVLVARQVLAAPAGVPGGPVPETWATLADGTPLVSALSLGAGRLVLFHVTANAGWSNLPLSGLFPQMLGRLIALSVGIRPVAAQAPLPPRRALDGFGQLGDPPPAARPAAAAALATLTIGPAHPPGLYGPADGARAVNLGTSVPLAAAAPIAGATVGGFATAAPATRYGPRLIAMALVLLAVDLLVALGLRGLMPVLAALLLLPPPLPIRAQVPAMPSLQTHLGYIRTGDPQADGISQAGLQGLSDYVNQRTAAELAAPVGLDPATDDLSFYPLLYWPILADSPDPDGAALARLDTYMENGGIVVFDTRDAGAPDVGADAALRRIGATLGLPALAPLGDRHVLSHSFYLLHDWPGRLDGGTVWVASAQDPANDGVSPVVIGANDWAAAWATDGSGATLYTVTPGGEDQRLLAYRFGVNLVMYALTGNYKQDQIKVPELLQRMGNGGDGDGGDGAPP